MWDVVRCECIIQLEKAYDKLMMAQLTNRKKGVTFGSFKVNVGQSFFLWTVKIAHIT